MAGVDSGFKTSSFMPPFDALRESSSILLEFRTSSFTLTLRSIKDGIIQSEPSPEPLISSIFVITPSSTSTLANLSPLISQIFTLDISIWTTPFRYNFKIIN